MVDKLLSNVVGQLSFSYSFPDIGIGKLINIFLYNTHGNIVIRI